MKPTINYIFLISILLFTSCQSKQEDYKIDSIKMVDVLSDIHLSEVALQSVSVSLKDSMAQVYYQQVFEIHGTNQEDFDHDINLIRSQAKDLKVYYAKVLEKLAEGEREFLSNKKESKPKEKDTNQ